MRRLERLLYCQPSDDTRWIIFSTHDMRDMVSCGV
jgi:hypothetical protein